MMIAAVGSLGHHNGGRFGEVCERGFLRRELLRPHADAIDHPTHEHPIKAAETRPLADLPEVACRVARLAVGEDDGLGTDADHAAAFAVHAVPPSGKLLRLVVERSAIVKRQSAVELDRAHATRLRRAATD